MVYDLRTGDLRKELGGETASGCSFGDYSCDTRMNALVINRQGFTAAHTILLSGGCAGPATDSFCETIQVSDSGGPHTVDTAASPGAKPVLTDLALSGDTLTWRHAGAPQSIQLH